MTLEPWLLPSCVAFCQCGFGGLCYVLWVHTVSGKQESVENWKTAMLVSRTIVYWFYIAAITNTSFFFFGLK